MRTKTSFGMCVLLAFVFSLLTAGCAGNDKDAIEYVNEEVSYADGEVCVERYLLDEENGTYERYIAGMYFGNEVPGIYFGTLFETGMYALSEIEGETAQKIIFSPKKQYDFDTKRLEYLGLEGQVPYYGTLTDKTLTITWEVQLSLFEKAAVPIIYTRK